VTDILHAPGFLGTDGNFAADATLIAMIIIALLFSYGFYLARQGKFDQHKWMQSIGGLANVILVLWLMVLPFRDFVLQDQGGPRLAVFYGVTRAHALIGTLAVLFGLFVILRGHGLLPKFLRFQNYKPYMRLAYALYILNTVVGIAVYYVWFVLVPNPPIY